MNNIKVTKNVPEKNKNHAEITIEGELILQNAGELKKLIQKNISGLDSAKIIIKNVDQTDITFIQIIEALKKQFKSHGQKLTIETEYPYDVKNLLTNAGFEAKTGKQQV